MVTVLCEKQKAVLGFFYNAYYKISTQRKVLPNETELKSFELITMTEYKYTRRNSHLFFLTSFPSVLYRGSTHSHTHAHTPHKGWFL